MGYRKINKKIPFRALITYQLEECIRKNMMQMFLPFSMH